MAEEAAPEDTAEAPAGKLSKKKKIIIVAALVVVLAGAGAGAYFGGFIGGKKKETVEGEKGEHAEGEKGEHGEAVAEKGAPVYYSLPEFLVNLNTGGKQTSFLKMQVSLELPAQADVAAVEANLPRIQDSFNTYLRELRPSDLSGSAGIYRLKQELLLRLNKNVAPAKVNDILFKEILVQ